MEDIYFKHGPVVCSQYITTQSRLLTTLRKFLKTLWEKEDMLVTSIFSFSSNFFCSTQIKVQFFSHIFMLSTEPFSLRRSKIFSSCKDLKGKVIAKRYQSILDTTIPIFSPPNLPPPTKKDGGAYCFTVVSQSVYLHKLTMKTPRLILLQGYNWYEGLSQGQGHLPRSRSNTAVTFKKTVVLGGISLPQTQLF